MRINSVKIANVLLTTYKNKTKNLLLLLLSKMRRNSVKTVNELLTNYLLTYYYISLNENKFCQNSHCAV